MGQHGCPPGVKLAGHQPRVNRPRGRHERRALVSGRAIARDDGPLPSRSAVGVPSAESQRASGEGVVPTSKVEDDPCARVCACESGAVVGDRGGSGSGPVCEASKQCHLEHLECGIQPRSRGGCLLFPIAIAQAWYGFEGPGGHKT